MEIDTEIEVEKPDFKGGEIVRTLTRRPRVIEGEVGEVCGFATTLDNVKVDFLSGESEFYRSYAVELDSERGAPYA